MPNAVSLWIGSGFEVVAVQIQAGVEKWEVFRHVLSCVQDGTWF